MPRTKNQKFPKPKPLIFDSNFKQNWELFQSQFNIYYSKHDYLLQNNEILEKLLEYISIPELLEALKANNVDIFKYRTVKSVQKIISTLIELNEDEKLKHKFSGQNKLFTTFQEEDERIDDYFSRISPWCYCVEVLNQERETLRWEQLVFGVKDDEKRQRILEERMDYWKIFDLFRKEETLNMPVKKTKTCKAKILEESVKSKLTDAEIAECNSPVCPECEQLKRDGMSGKCKICVKFCSFCGEVGHQISNCGTKHKVWN